MASASGRRVWLCRAALVRAATAPPGLAFFLCASLLGVLVFVPFGSPIVGVEPDLSLRMTLHDAFARHLQYGRDIVFPYGPWSILLGGFDARTWPTVLVVSLALGVVFGWTAMALARTLSMAAVPALLATATTAALFLSGGDDVRFIGIPVLMLIWNLVEPHPSRWLPRAPLVTAVAVIALVKGSYFVIALIVIGSMALRLHSATTKLLALFVVSLAVAWIAAGQS